MAATGARFLTELLRPPPPVRRYRDTYAVEATGIIWTLASPSERIRPTRSKSGILLIPGTKLEVARVVAETWVPNPSMLADIDHIDGNRFNVAAANLAWK